MTPEQEYAQGSGRRWREYHDNNSQWEYVFFFVVAFGFVGLILGMIAWAIWTEVQRKRKALDRKFQKRSQLRQTSGKRLHR